MADENTIPMNLDLNLAPVSNTSDNDEVVMGPIPFVRMNLEEWLHIPTRREIIRQRNQRWRSLWWQLAIPQEAQNLAMELMSRPEAPTGEDNVASEERPNCEQDVACDNGTNSQSKEELLDKKKDGEKNNIDEGSYFDCNICLDLAKEPVVTCCGHLFCWPCLYRWLHHHSDAKECPVCKGEVTVKRVTPIYGRGADTRKPNLETMKIPLRPQARRIESWRQAFRRAAFPMEEMIRRLGTTFDLARELGQITSSNPDVPRESPERRNSRLNRFLTSRGMHRDINPIVASDDMIDLTEASPPQNFEPSDSNGRVSSSVLRRMNSSHRVNTPSVINLSDDISANERSVESYLNFNLFEISPDLTLPVDDRDSMSSIAAVIHSESQTIDNAVEIDSTVARSTSSSRRRSDASRVSDVVDSEDSRANRRRRLY